MHWDYFGQRTPSESPARLASGISDSDTPSADEQVIASYGVASPLIFRQQTRDSSDDPDFTGAIVQIYGAGPFPPVSGALFVEDDRAVTSASYQSGPMPVGVSGPVTITSTGTASPTPSATAAPTPAKSGVGLGTVAVVAVAALGVAWAAGWLK